LNLHGVTPTST